MASMEENKLVWRWDGRDRRIEFNPDDKQDQGILAYNRDEDDIPVIDVSEAKVVASIEKNCSMLRKCLTGVLQYSRCFSPKRLEALLQKAWNIKQGHLCIKAQRDNTILISFEDGEERDSVLEGSPWNVEGGLLMLAPWQDKMAMESFRIEKSPIWVQIRGLSNDFLSPQMAVKVGTVAGEVRLIDWEESNSYMRLRTIIRPDEPLVAGVYLLDQDGNKKHWVEFRYERVCILCIRCGVIGHVKNYCSMSTSQMNLRAHSKVKDIRAKLQQDCYNAKDLQLLVKFHGTYDLHLIETAAQQGQVHA